MGSGSFIAGLGSTVGIIIIIIGALLCLTGIGALIGIPLIIIGIMAIAGGAAGGAVVGATSATYKAVKESRSGTSHSHHSDTKHCIDCGEKIVSHAKHCPHCGAKQ